MNAAASSTSAATTIPTAKPQASTASQLTHIPASTEMTPAAAARSGQPILPGASRAHAAPASSAATKSSAAIIGATARGHARQLGAYVPCR